MRDHNKQNRVTQLWQRSTSIYKIRTFVFQDLHLRYVVSAFSGFCVYYIWCTSIEKLENSTVRRRGQAGGWRENAEIGQMKTRRRTGTNDFPDRGVNYGIWRKYCDSCNIIHFSQIFQIGWNRDMTGVRVLLLFVCPHFLCLLKERKISENLRNDPDISIVRCHKPCDLWHCVPPIMCTFAIHCHEPRLAINIPPPASARPPPPTAAVRGEVWWQ